MTYMVVCQVTDDVPMYKVRDDTHCNRLFLVAPAKKDAMPLGGRESISDEGATRSALAELTPLEWRSEMPESEVAEVLTQCLSGHRGSWEKKQLAPARLDMTIFKSMIQGQR